MRLHAVGGLANRLRAILSYRAFYGDLTVIWDADEYVSHGLWSDVFEPLPRVTFTSAVHLAWDYEDWAPHANAPQGWEEAYREVRLVPPLARTVATLEETCPAFVACHIRRTDMLPLLEQEKLPVEPLGSWVEWTKQWPHLQVYVSTDNGETQAMMRRHLGPRAWMPRPLPGGERQGLVDHRRNGTLADAVIDLVVCQKATHFKGSIHSSFTDTITTMRKLHARTDL
jgi:GDP-fucose protein O-fucosyltransferase